MTQPPAVPPQPPPGQPSGQPVSSSPFGQPPGGAFPAPPPPSRGWFGRNWKWFVPLVIVLPIVLCCGGISLLVGGVFGMIKSSEPYQYAVAQAQANPQVTAALGTPVKTGFFAAGSINVNNDDGDANLTIPVSGPNGSGNIYVNATKTDGVWSYETLEFRAAGSQERIDLRPAEP